MIKNTDLAYAAGYIDGDGCFHIGKYMQKNRLSPKFPVGLIISSAHSEVLIWFKEMFGGTYHPTNATQPKNHSPMYNYTLRKSKAIPFIQNILPYLVEKVAEANLTIAFANSKDIKEKINLIEQMGTIKNFTNLVHPEMKQEFERDRNTIAPTSKDFAYLAGFIDAECSLGIQKYRDKNKSNYLYKIQLQCSNTKAPVFKWLLQHFGGQVHFVDHNSRDPKKRNVLTWRLTSASLAKILSEIRPFLKHKQPVCDELIKFKSLILPNGGARHTEIFRSNYARILEEREIIVQKVHSLNLRGIKNF